MPLYPIRKHHEEYDPVEEIEDQLEQYPPEAVKKQMDATFLPVVRELSNFSKMEVSGLICNISVACRKKRLTPHFMKVMKDMEWILREIDLADLEGDV